MSHARFQQNDRRNFFVAFGTDDRTIRLRGRRVKHTFADLLDANQVVAMRGFHRARVASKVSMSSSLRSVRPISSSPS
jgi:hypothetical protein